MEKAPRSKSKAEDPKEWNLRLYVDGRAARSLRALKNLKRICEEHLSGNYRIEVIDLVKSPRMAAIEQIVALPTLVRRIAGRPVVKMIGDLSDTEKVIAGLELNT